MYSYGLIDPTLINYPLSGKHSQPPTKQEPRLIWGLEWWELLCIVFGSVLVLLFACVCCCAILESSQIQRQEVLGPNGERLGFMQAPGNPVKDLCTIQLFQTIFRGRYIVLRYSSN